MWVVFPNTLVVMCRCYVGLPCTNIVARLSVITSWVLVTFDLYVKLGRECCSLVDLVNKLRNIVRAGPLNLLLLTLNLE